MADVFNTLTFSRDWRVNDTKENGGFPTLESREEVVREDMQFLHEETKDFINNTMRPAIQALADRQTVSFSHVPTIGENGNWQLWSEDEQKYVDSGISAWQGDMSTALEKVAQEAAAAVTLDDLGAYSKEETLSDATKELYGLDKEAKPDDALAKIHEYVAEKAAYMVGQNASETTGKDCTEFCDITVPEGSTLEYFVGPVSGFSFEMRLNRLPDNMRVVRLPEIRFSGEYTFSGSHDIVLFLDVRISLNGKIVYDEPVAETNRFWLYSYDSSLKNPARPTSCVGRGLRRGDVLSFEVVPRELNTLYGQFKIEDLIVTPTNARCVEV